MALRLIPRSLRRSGFLVTVPGTMRKHRRRVDAGVEASRPRGFVVRSSAFVSCAIRGHRIPRPTSVTIAIRPSWWARDGRRDASDLPDATSEMVCDRMARRANHLWDTNSLSSAPCIEDARTRQFGLLRGTVLLLHLTTRTMFSRRHKVRQLPQLLTGARCT